MHPSALNNVKRFYDAYYQGTSGKITIVEIGSQDVNGSIRSMSPKNSNYIGLDFAEGEGVDIVINDPYKLPLDDCMADVVVTSSCFEHSEMFWLSFLEAIRILKDNGVLYVNVPSNSMVHRFPLDCWRFYPDAGVALQNWAKKNNYNTLLLESFVARKEGDMWNDFVAIFLKDSNFLSLYPNRIINNFSEYDNGRLLGNTNVIKDTLATQDLELIHYYKTEVDRLNAEIVELNQKIRNLENENSK